MHELEKLTSEELATWPPEAQTQFLEKLKAISEAAAARPDLVAFLKAHPKQLRFIRSLKRVIAFFGGNKSGKSYAGGMKCIGRMLAKPRTAIWAASENFPMSRDAQQKAVWDLLPKGFIKYGEYRPETGFREQVVVLKNESFMRFKTCDGGYEGFQGAEALDIVWFDEEPPDKKFYDEAFMRTADNPTGQVIFTLTPTHGFTWTFAYLKTTKKPYIEVLMVETKDNEANLPPGRCDELYEEYGGTELAASRLRGEHAALGGVAYFDSNSITSLVENAVDGARWRIQLVGKTAIREKDPKGLVEAWEEPQKGEAYYVGVDTGEGLGEDDSVVWVLKGKGQLPVAVMYSNRIQTDDLAKLAFAVGVFYNTATLVVERNGLGSNTLLTLQRMKYPNLWKDHLKKDSPPGFFSTERRREQLCHDLDSALRDRVLPVRHQATLFEMSTFVRSDGGKPEAQRGSKDDLVIALGLALQGRLTDVGGPQGTTPRLAALAVARDSESAVEVMMEW